MPEREGMPPEEHPAEDHEKPSWANKEFHPTKYNPEPGHTLPRLEQEDIEKEVAAEVEAESGAELRALGDEAFQQRYKAIIQQTKAAREALQPSLHLDHVRGNPLDRDTYRRLAKAEELAKLCGRIQNERLGQPPEILVS